MRKAIKSHSQILLTAGDPHGIGYEVILKAISPFQYPDILIIGSFRVFQFYNELFNLSVPLNPIENNENGLLSFDNQKLNIVDLAYQSEIKPGTLTKEAGELALRTIDKAISLIKEGYQTLVTAPINKKGVCYSYPSFIGHTEYLANAFNVDNVTMLLMSEKIKVAIVTTHLPLSEVSRSISFEKVLVTIRQTHKFLKHFPHNQGRIAVSALNPHGGEMGRFGEEEQTIIEPAVQKAKDEGILVYGPYPADTLFSSAMKDSYDLFIAMYHDQGLIPIKLLSFGQGVNVTLGLPFFRVSVDHGTAYNIAGQGKADPNSMKSALDLAFQFKPI